MVWFTVAYSRSVKGLDKTRKREYNIVEYMYAQPGINADRCESKRCKGSVFFSITLDEFYEICHAGARKKLGKCGRCGRERWTEFRRPLGPAMVEEKHRQIILRRLSQGG